MRILIHRRSCLALMVLGSIAVTLGVQASSAAAAEATCDASDVKLAESQYASIVQLVASRVETENALLEARLFLEWTRYCAGSASYAGYCFAASTYFDHYRQTIFKSLAMGLGEVSAIQYYLMQKALFGKLCSGEQDAGG